MTRKTQDRDQDRIPYDKVFDFFVRAFLPALKKLDVRYEQVLRLKLDKPQLSHAEIGAQLEISAMASQLRLHRGRLLVTGLMEQLPPRLLQRLKRLKQLQRNRRGKKK